MMSALWLLLLAVPLVSAQRFHWGLCPKPSLQANFSLSQFQGRWFEHRRLPSLYERGSCIQASIQPVSDSIQPDSIQPVSDSIQPVSDNTQIVFSQTIDNRVDSSTPAVISQNPAEPAKLVFGYFYNLIQLSWWVLETDYKSTAVVYYCKDCFNLFHFDLAWLIGRTRTAPPPAALHAAAHTFQRVNLNISHMVVADQSDCEDP